MRAVVVEAFGPPGLAPVREIPRPAPSADEVLLRVEAVAANFVDILVLQGRYQFLPERPFTPGKGPVGVVEAVGERVERVRPGDHVLCMAESGGYAQYATGPESQTYRLPEGMSFAEAASLSLAADTAWVALMERGRLKAGETVLVLGASGAVGAAALQIARAKGARTIAGVASQAGRRRAKEAGADAVVDLAAGNLKESLREQVRAVTDGAGADVVLDMLGGDAFGAALRATAWRGRLVVVGFAAGEIPTVKVNYLMLKNIEVSGLQVSDYRKRMPDLMRACFEDLFALYDRGALRASPVTLYTLDGYAEALEAVRGRRIGGRAVIEPWTVGDH